MKKRITLYLVFSIAIAWAIWIGIWALGWQYTAATYTGLLTSLSMFAPAAGVLIAKLLDNDKRPILFASMKPRFKGNLLWYLLALVGPFILTVLGALVYFAIFPSHLDFSLGYLRTVYEAAMPAGFEVTPALLMTGLVSSMISAVTLAPLINMLLAVGEEVGWRGFLFPAFRQSLSPAKAHVLVGIIWGLWHTPINALMGHNYGLDYAGYPWLGMLAMCVFCFSIGVLFSWLVEKTGSVWPAALAHGSVNAAAGLPIYFLNLEANYNQLLGPYSTGLIAGLPALALAIVVLIWEQKKYTASKATGAAEAV